MKPILLGLCLTGCTSTDGVAPDDSGSTDTDADTDTDTDTDSDTDTDTDTDTDSDTDTDTDTDTDPCGEDGLVDLTVTDIQLSTVAPDAVHVLSATSPGPGTIAVDDEAFALGCCPDVTIEAQGSCRTGVIAPSYTLTNDVCDCYMGLELVYALNGVPDGAWTVRSDGLDAAVTVGARRSTGTAR